jgi:hypothetical protein
MKLNSIKKLTLVALVVTSVVVSLNAQAIQAGSDVGFSAAGNVVSAGFDYLPAQRSATPRSQAGGAGQSIAAPQLNPPYFDQPSVWLADNDDEFRSKADVIRDVKKRYDARVLKISLNEKRGIYRVRILMPSGKIRNITMSARR